MPRLRHVVASLTLLALTATASARDGWLTNMDEARRVAAAEGKDILIDFTGSDWCGWCIRLDREVFDQSLFMGEVPKSFVLVELDFPRKKKLPAEVRKHNDEWKRKFAIRGFPTIMLTDSKGEAFARTGYRPGGPAPYVDHLNALRKGREKRDALLEAAKGATGADRARMLDEVLQIQDVMVPNQVALMEEIVTLDADGSAGLRTKYVGRIGDLVMNREMPRIGRLLQDDPNAALAAIDALLAKHEPGPATRARIWQMRTFALIQVDRQDEALAYIASQSELPALSVDERQQILLMASQVHVRRGDRAGAIAVFDETLALDPNSGFANRLDRDAFIKQIEEQIASRGG